MKWSINEFCEALDHESMIPNDMFHNVKIIPLEIFHNNFASIHPADGNRSDFRG